MSYSRVALFLGLGAMLFLLSLAVGWTSDAEPPALVYVMGSCLTITAMIMIASGMLGALWARSPRLGVGAAAGAMLAILGIGLEVAVFFFGRSALDTMVLSMITNIILVLEYPGELLCGWAGIDLLRHASDVSDVRVLSEWPLVGAGSLLAWTLLGVAVVLPFSRFIAVEGAEAREKASRDTP